jgi:hypothetical protein
MSEERYAVSGVQVMRCKHVVTIQVIVLRRSYECFDVCCIIISARKIKSMTNNSNREDFLVC